MLRIYNTLTKKKEVFTPLSGNHVNFFVCGPTVYDYPHLGHAKTYTQFDFMVRYLRYTGHDVFYVQNITDIDDKIIGRAQEMKVHWKDLSEKFEAIYREDMASLGNDSVSKYARATDHIPQIIDQVKTLLEKGYAYSASDGIYYQVDKFHEYGKLSGRTELKEEDSVSRIDESQHKRGWNDFCLWKAAKPGEPFWESELGAGRPGWHIEDTAITEAHFGPQYDVHGGAIDLIFPHHECEIAQMEAASGKKPLVKYWIHTGFLNINTEKMSKSKGNFKIIRDALVQYHYRVIRYFLLSSHYRATIDFSIEGLEHAKNALDRIDNFLFLVDREYEDVENDESVNGLRDSVMEALDNDFATPAAFAHIFDFIRGQNSAAIRNGKRVLHIFDEFNQIFGIVFNTHHHEDNSTNDEIVLQINQREMHRQRKEFDKADEIRHRLKGMGIGSLPRK